jgi:hypothetical protein
MDCLNGSQAIFESPFVRILYFGTRWGSGFLTCETSPLSPALKPKFDMQSNHPLNHPKHSVPDAKSQRQHDSWSTQWGLFKFPGINSHSRMPKTVPMILGII